MVIRILCVSSFIFLWKILILLSLSVFPLFPAPSLSVPLCFPLLCDPPANIQSRVSSWSWEGLDGRGSRLSFRGERICELACVLFLFFRFFKCVLWNAILKTIYLPVPFDTKRERYKDACVPPRYTHTLFLLLFMMSRVDSDQNSEIDSVNLEIEDPSTSTCRFSLSLQCLFPCTLLLLLLLSLF